MNFELIDRLLSSSCYPQEKRERIEDRLLDLEGMEDEFSLFEFESIMQDLKDNQLDPLTHGTNYNQTDIKYHLKRLK